MRTVNKNENDCPAELVSADCLAHLNLIINSAGINGAKSEFYRGTVVLPSGEQEHRVVEALKVLYKYKCAYCEAYCYEPYVEHFRPKKRVVGGPSKNRGYYWLSYEWTNLVPSCHECNSITRKGDKFPIQYGRRSTHPVTGNPAVPDIIANRFDSHFLSSEGPLLVHPEYCPDPFVHFDFDRNGRIIGRTPEGRATINVIQLDRPDLNGWRRQIYEGHFDDLQEIVFDYKRQGSALPLSWFEDTVYRLVRKIVYQSLEIEKDYTLFKKAMVNNIEYFFIDPLDPVFQPDARMAIQKALLTL